MSQTTWQLASNSRPNCGGDHKGRRRIAATLLSATSGAALGTAAFVKLSEEKSGGGRRRDGDDEVESGLESRAPPRHETGEGRMLQASRDEIAKKVGDDERGLSRLRKRIVLFLDLYVWEPIATGFRFLNLLVIFVPVIATVPAVWVGRRHPDRDNERTGTLWWYNFLVESMESAGPAFIKLGQWAASRTDIFPTEMCEIMSRLHSKAPAHSMAATRQIVEAAFDGRPFDDIFEEFNEEPLGVGAIAQVYKAKLKPDLAAPGDLDLYDDKAGATTTLRENMRRSMDTVLKSTPKRVPSSYVAVKVVHPHIERVVQRDLRIMYFFASVLNAVPTLEWLSFPDEVAQFGEMMKLQLDLRIEAANLTIFRRNFKDRTTAWFPYPYAEFTTRNVLVEEFAAGMPLADFLEMGGGIFQSDIASEGLDAFLRMLLIDNFIHADLHPGNIMVRFYQAEKPSLPGQLSFKKDSRERHPSEQRDVTEEVLARLRPFRHGKDQAAWDAELARIDREGFRPQLIFIDTGLVTELSATNRRNFLDLFRAVAEFDGYRAGRLMCSRSRTPETVVDEEVFALRMQHLVIGVKSRTLALGSVKFGDVLQTVLGMVRAHHVRLEGDFVNVVISMLLLEGIGRNLDPSLDLLASGLPILRSLGAQQGREMIREGDFREGDFGMMMIWMGLETRRFLQTSIEDVERCVKYDLLSPNV